MVGAPLTSLSPFQAALLLTGIECVGDTSAKLNGTLPVYASYNAMAYVLPSLLRNNPMALVNGYW